METRAVPLQRRARATARDVLRVAQRIPNFNPFTGSQFDNCSELDGHSDFTYPAGARCPLIFLNGELGRHSLAGGSKSLYLPAVELTVIGLLAYS